MRSNNYNIHFLQHINYLICWFNINLNLQTHHNKIRISSALTLFLNNLTSIFIPETQPFMFVNVCTQSISLNNLCTINSGLMDFNSSFNLYAYFSSKYWHIYTYSCNVHSILCLKKMSHLWLAITLTHMNGFWYFLAEMLPISRQSKDTLLCHLK